MKPGKIGTNPNPNPNTERGEGIGFGLGLYLPPSSSSSPPLLPPLHLGPLVLYCHARSTHGVGDLMGVSLQILPHGSLY